VNAEVLCDRFEISGCVREAALRAQARVAALRYPAQEAVAASVLRAFLDEGIDESALAGTSGYGYDDAARAHYEWLSIVRGTHAIVATIAACVPPGETLLSITGTPYDTLRNAIADAPDSLVAQGTRYREIPLTKEGIDLAAVREALRSDEIAAVFIQRSRGYAPRPSLSVDACAAATAAVKEASPQTLVLVDNCYGELVQTREPTHDGADLVMGSLIKNLGGTLAPGGGYVAGRSTLVDRVATRLYAPGLHDRLGPTLGFGKLLVQGLFQAPLVVEQCLRGLDFAAALFEALGFDVDPTPGAVRCDIVQAIRLGDPESLLRFAGGLQSAMPLNARFRPEPGAVPGYTAPVVMSSGAFVGGATIELSCDAPMRPPYEVYLQGGISRAHGMLGALFAARAVTEAL